MSNMFKKTLVAAALTASASSAFAVQVVTNVDNAPAIASTEYVASRVAQSDAANRTVALPANWVKFTPEVVYSVNDIIEVTFTGATVSKGLNPTITSALAGATVSFQGYSANNANTLVFAVTAAPGTPAAIPAGVGSQFSLSGVTFEAASVTGPVTVSYRATNATGTVVKDNSGTTSRVVLNTRSQYSASVTLPLDAKVDPAKRTRFVSDGTADQFKFKIANREPISPATSGVWNDDLVIADVNRLNVTFDGAFGSFTNSAGTRLDVLTCQAYAGTAITNETAPADVNSRLALRYTANGTPATALQAFASEFTCDVNLSGVTSAVPLTEFKVALQLASGSNSRFTVANLTAGQFSLDATEIIVPYMPFGDNIDNIINLTNSSSIAGDITVEAIDRTGKKYGPVKVGTAAAGTQVALGTAIKAELVKAGMPANERAQLSIVTNVKSGIQLYTAFNASGTGARLVVNSSNGK